MIRIRDRGMPVFLSTTYPDLMKREVRFAIPLSASERRGITVRRNYATPPRVGHLAQIHATGVGKCILFA
jgi:hypothetical protein